MKILLSAYACEPNKGSEPGVGWNWAIEYAKSHEVWVLTRDNNEHTISEYMMKNSEFQNKNLHFIYVGVSKKLTFWKKGRRGMRLFYMLWQRKAAKIAIELNKKIKFDFIQHVTFVSYTQPIYMYKVGIPLIFGPVSGGENIPSGIKIKMSKKEKIVEVMRKISQRTALVTPAIRKTMSLAKVIFVATDDTRKCIPQKYQDKTYVLPAIGIAKMPQLINKKQNMNKIKIIMAGRLINWKAFDIGIKGFLKVADKYEMLELHILGEGNQKKRLEILSKEKLEKQIFFEEPVEHDNIYEFYENFDLFINTTLRDSGCRTMMEAMASGLPCIAIATGGPKELLKEFDECKIDATTYQSCIDTVAIMIEDYVNHVDKWRKIAEEQRNYATENFTIDKKIKYVQKIVR